VLAFGQRPMRASALLVIHLANRQAPSRPAQLQRLLDAPWHIQYLRNLTVYASVSNGIFQQKMSIVPILRRSSGYLRRSSGLLGTQVLARVAEACGQQHTVV
jgi:hypothetical protein